MNKFNWFKFCPNMSRIFDSRSMLGIDVNNKMVKNTLRKNSILIALTIHEKLSISELKNIITELEGVNVETARRGVYRVLPYLEKAYFIRKNYSNTYEVTPLGLAAVYALNPIESIKYVVLKRAVDNVDHLRGLDTLLFLIEEMNIRKEHGVLESLDINRFGFEEEGCSIHVKEGFRLEITCSDLIRFISYCNRLLLDRWDFLFLKGDPRNIFYYMFDFYESTYAILQKSSSLEYVETIKEALEQNKGPGEWAIEVLIWDLFPSDIDLLGDKIYELSPREQAYVRLAEWILENDIMEEKGYDILKVYKETMIILEKYAKHISSYVLKYLLNEVKFWILYFLEDLLPTIIKLNEKQKVFSAKEYEMLVNILELIKHYNQS